MNILLITTISAGVINFRAGLIKKLVSLGFYVNVICSDDTYKDEILELGCGFYNLGVDNRGVSIFSNIKYYRNLNKKIQDISPDIVFSFQIKPNTFGVLAAKKAGIKNIYSMVEGAGDVFINNGLKWKIIRKIVCVLYKKAFRNSKKVFFLNNDDKTEFIQRKLVKPEQCEVVHGIGVDLEKFSYKSIKSHKTFLMVARMLKTKGVYEYCKCARIVKQKYPDAVFNYLGAEGTVTLADIKEYVDDGSINYLGTTTDVRPYLEDCSMFLLLSNYREGLPMSIMEAEAVGRGIITSNGVGCRDTVVDGYNGFIISQGDYEQMAEKVIWCIEHPEEAEQMGKNARRFAEENFDDAKINTQVCEVLNQ